MHTVGAQLDKANGIGDNKQIDDIQILYRIRLQAFRQTANQMRTIVGPPLAMLLCLENSPPEMPVHHYAVEIHAAHGGTPRIRDNGTSIR